MMLAGPYLWGLSRNTQGDFDGYYLDGDPVDIWISRKTHWVSAIGAISDTGRSVLVANLGAISKPPKSWVMFRNRQHFQYSPIDVKGPMLEGGEEDANPAAHGDNDEQCVPGEPGSVSGIPRRRLRQKSPRGRRDSTGLAPPLRSKEWAPSNGQTHGGDPSIITPAGQAIRGSPYAKSKCHMGRRCGRIVAILLDRV